jgi:ClpP class serine protease
MKAFVPNTPLALLPAAFGQEYPGQPQASLANRKQAPGIVIVPIRGPLTHHPEPGTSPFGDSASFDSYDAIKARVAAALGDGETKTVILAIDSPGGHALGVFSCALELRNLARTNKKRLIARVDGMACSAAYALACACERIYAAPGAIVGSIGIVDAVLDQTGNDRRTGCAWSLITSGARKADGHAHVRVTAAQLAARQGIIDSLGATFFDLVAESRGISPRTIANMRGASFTAEQGKGVGLVDEIATLSELTARLSAVAAR